MISERFLGGTFGAIQGIIVIAMAIGLVWFFKDAQLNKQKIIDLRAEVVVLEGEIKSQAITNNSQQEMSDARVKASEEKESVIGAINETGKTNYVSKSDAIAISLGIVPISREE